MSDSAAVDAAIFSALQSDTALMALLPGGVWFGSAPQAHTKVVIVSMTDHTDVYLFQGPSHEEFVYAVTALVKDRSVTVANEAEARINAVMRALPNPTGYTLMLAQRQKRIAFPIPDDTNLDEVWQQRGGLYDVHVEPLEEP
jgi:hypothetical protein